MNGPRWKAGCLVACLAAVQVKNCMYEMCNVILDGHVDSVGRNGTYCSLRVCIPPRRGVRKDCDDVFEWI